LLLGDPAVRAPPPPPTTAHTNTMNNGHDIIMNVVSSDQTIAHAIAST
jgi:hypothetical protein